MTQQEILESGLNKTEKMKKLFALGLSRVEVASLLGCRYGFVQNVYAKYVSNQAAPTVAELFRLTNFTFAHKFGVEIEAYGIARDELLTSLNAAGVDVEFRGYTHARTTVWKVVSDSSINGENPFELVSPVLEGEGALPKLKTALLITRGLGARVNRTCGLHVHFDARQMTAKQLKNLVVNYGRLQELIDKWMPASRRGDANRYCKSIDSRTIREAERISDADTLEDALRKIERAQGRDRYFKLNLQSYWRHKSVEFRQHGGTTDPNKIKSWVEFCARLVEFSKHARFEANEPIDLTRFLSIELINYFRNRSQELA